MNLEDWTVTQAANAIRNGSLSPVEFVTALLARIEKVEPEIHAWVTLNRDGAIQEARACEAEARDGRLRGPLHGVPVGIKDIFYTKDLRTTAGSRFLQTFSPEYDAVAVDRLRSAGAI